MKTIEDMEQTINFLTERERLLDDINQAIRETQYPPLNGGPTTEDLVGLLKGAADTIAEQEYQADEMEELADRVGDLESAIEDATDKIDDILFDLSLAINSGEFPACKTLEEMETQLMEIRSDLRRA